ncbi:MAG: DUF2188 domain-containing protein [Bacteroidota bacterium]
MPWSNKDFPASMKNLPKEVRQKAIEIANALQEETSMDEGITIATAMSRAKDWAANRGKPTATRKAGSPKTDVKKHGQDRYVVPHDDAWAVKVEGSSKVRKVFKNKQQAVKTARQEARAANASLTIQKKSGRVQKRISYNPAKRAPKQR